MPLVLAAIVAFIVLGIAAPRRARVQGVGVAVIAMSLALLQLAFPRFL